ncbi:alkanesulfonate monooxygenase SsuD/methylene tetrahydromethanopterin reductase-like flavin-dependent oxidoreductase (luciferase family) [Tamaricihabitans halophyticus]|uniref:Alkanesulfonate monooxygenase SsuD/methylene tetrahydromethanopterin reductase-like flavin-dependent oxidoreductase (Luciferase family) n=1 Tax=Tamaricihabitans halophyticus TaxID=1262583 RepID=A0A4R2Q9W0_9PSEU|nr:LLM class flavin-dependent oxidoreductase [Tamaricihabitans halophyticus]TCP43611.1 alkanesulfonate monooxygenase SsuD/methylene tetrahydromethanopterin reductase-like flavin-dependent oxidoreductase (luciferase family) [Tamaricihabitans halophyticus]
MPLGLSVASRSGLPARRFGELAAYAETAGFDNFFVAERVADSLALCQAALAATSTITVGTAVANARLRHPALTAMTAATMDEQHGGRFLLGLGVANPALNEDSLGIPPAAPVPFMRDYVASLREVLAGGLGLDRPARREVPVYLAGLRPRMLRLAAEIGDGVLLNLTTSRTIPDAIAQIRAAGRQPAVGCVLPCALGVDRADARDAGAELILGYARHPAAARIFAASGHTDELARLARLLDDGRRAEALRQVSDALVDDFLLWGDEQEVAGRLRTYLAAGVDLPILFPIGTAGDQPDRSGLSEWDTAVRRTVEVAARIRPLIDRANH